MAGIRALKSALANAEAVPLVERPFELIEGSADVPRRRLDRSDIARVVTAEIDERQRAIREYERLGADTTALRVELTTLQRYRETS